MSALIHTWKRGNHESQETHAAARQEWPLQKAEVKGGIMASVFDLLFGERDAMKKPAAKPARKPAAIKTACKPKKVTPEFLATLSPEVQEIYRLARKARRYLD